MMLRRALGALLVLGLCVAGLVTAPAAHAAPPVTTPDAATVFQGNFVAVFPINNDKDPDNDLLTICRLGTEHYRGIDVGFFGDEVDFVVDEKKAAPGVYTFTYYACDFQTLVPGTITLTVQDLPDIKVTKKGVGKIKVKNPFDFRIRFLYGSFKAGSPDGKAKIPAGGSVVIEVHRHKIDWVADAKKGTIFCGSGHIKGIELPPAAGRPSPLTGSPRLADTWRAAG
jgi:hypothetical protein